MGPRSAPSISLQKPTTLTFHDHKLITSSSSLHSIFPLKSLLTPENPSLIKKMSSANENKNMHIVMYPWFALSHLTSFLRLSNKLAEKGHKISFFLPAKTQPKLSPHNHRPHLITFIPVALPPIDGLPAGVETSNDVTEASALPLLATAFDMTRDTMDTHLARLRPDFVFFDGAYWMPGLARAHGAKSLFYATSGLAWYAYISFRARNLPIDHRLTVEELMRPAAGFPVPGMELRAEEARSISYVIGVEFGAGMTLMDRINTSLEECDVIGSKTCREMEGVYCDYFEKHMDKPVLLAGPMVPDPPALTLDAQFDRWLKGFSKGSVVYCALGSECTLNKEQFDELVLGLELTGMPFLVALKPPTECETIESALPEGFLERVKGRGIVHGGWVQQPLILQHPSLGCFVTHCGAGSLSEALLSECQLVLLPQAVDQFINAKMMSIDLKVGIEVDRRENDNFFTKEAVCNAISMVMQVENPVGKEVKANHAKWKQVLLKEGLEDSYISIFIQSLQDLLA